MKVVIMEWKGIFYSLLFLVPTLESSSRSLNLWSLNLENGPTIIRNWAIISSGMFVVVAVLLSVFLIIQHLASYNQPEDQKFLIGLILMVPVYALEPVERKELLSTYMFSVCSCCPRIWFSQQYLTDVGKECSSTLQTVGSFPQSEMMTEKKFSSIRSRCCL